MPIHLKFSNSLARLREVIAGRSLSGLDPFEQEYIVVASTGLRRWLSHGLAARRGIHGNAAFPTPRRFVAQLLKDALQARELDAFSPDSMTWRIYRSLMDEPTGNDLQVPVDYIRKNEGSEQLAALQLSRKLADLFDQYLTYRPDWILTWDRGGAIEVPGKRLGESHISRLRMHERWQRRLWQDLSAGGGVHRAALYKNLIERLYAEPVGTLPEHISVFGTHTLPPVFLSILKALSQHHEVSILLTQPTPEFWGDHPLKALRSRKLVFLTETCANGIDEDWGNPLIAAMGGQGRDLFNVLIDEGLSTSEKDDMVLFGEPEATTVLGAVQRSVYRMERQVDRITDSPETDDSLRIHCCHHPLREIEVVRDFLLDCFRKDPGLLPNEILVMAPDIEPYAPLIEAVFGQPEDVQLAIPFAIADTTYRSKSRIVDGFYNILEFCQGRFATTDLFALLLSPVFRKRFDWDDTDLGRIRNWLIETGTAWGMDARHRQSCDLPPFRESSWEETFEQLFLGYAQAHDPADAHTFDQVEGQDSILIGKLAEAFSLLKEIAVAIRNPMAPHQWAQVLEARIVRPFLENIPENTLEVRQIRSGLNKLAESAAGMDQPVELRAVKSFLESIIVDGIPARGFLSKGVTFGSLTPMRAIPHKVVCLLGMQSGAFPKDTHPSGFDLMQFRGLVRTGDRSAVQSGRYLFLETLLSASDKLHISYSGYSARDDSSSPPATPVGELLDFLHITWEPADDKLRNSPFLVSHRLHGHHPGYFEAADPRLYSYSKSNYETALASLFDKAALIPGQIERPSIPEVLTNDELCGFLLNPARYFLAKQTGVQLLPMEKQLQKDEPLELDSLQRYLLLESGILSRTGWPAKPVVVRLPPGRYGEWCGSQADGQAEAMFNELNAAAMLDLAGEPEAIDIQVPLMSGQQAISLVATIPRVYEERHIRFRPSRLKVKDELQAWIDHLLLNAAGMGINTEVYYHETKVRKLTYGRMDQSSAVELLQSLLGHYIAGQGSPLPWIPQCSMAYATAVLNGREDHQAISDALNAWLPATFSPAASPSTDPWTVLCWGHSSPFGHPYTRQFADTAMSIVRPMKVHQNFQ